MDDKDIAKHAMEATIYQKLDFGNNEIRLLTLHPAQSKDSPIQCTLCHASLLSPSLPAYEAVSYVWGEYKFDSPILLNGQYFYVTSNLGSILRYLRQNEESRLLWVDALCINQRDTQERAEQVGLMRTIFSRCKQTLAWLTPKKERLGLV